MMSKQPMAVAIAIGPPTLGVAGCAAAADMVHHQSHEWKVGQLWLRLHKDMRPRTGEMPGGCALIARGVSLPAGSEAFGPAQPPWSAPPEN